QKTPSNPIRTLLINSARCFLLLLLLAPAAIYAQDRFQEPSSLFNVSSAPRLQALNAEGQLRLETLKKDAPTQSIRLVGIVDSLSQRRSLVINWNGQAVEPDVRPDFVRTPATEEDVKDRLNGTTTLFIQRDTIK